MRRRTASPFAAQAMAAAEAVMRECLDFLAQPPDQASAKEMAARHAAIRAQLANVETLLGFAGPAEGKVIDLLADIRSRIPPPAFEEEETTEDDDAGG